MSRDDLIETGAAGIGIDTRDEYDEAAENLSAVFTVDAINNVLGHYGHPELTEAEKKDLAICTCGRGIKNFVHNCPENPTMPEVYGCPKCDDVCGLCLEK